MNAKQVALKFAWRTALVLNILGSFLALSFIFDEFRNAKTSYIGNLGWVISLTVFIYAEVVIMLLVRAFDLIREERKG